MNKNKTLIDVAAAAGVSKMTASRALRGSKDVSTESKDRVIAAAKKIGYFGNHLAASLSSARSDLVGVIVPSLTNIVFPQVMSGISDGLLGTGFQPAFGVTDYNLYREYELVGRMLSWRPAGMIITGMEQSDQTRKLLIEADIPIVQIMDTDGDAIDYVVGFSHQSAGAEMAEALFGAGRTRFGYIGCNLENDLRAKKRKQGFFDVLKRYDIAITTQLGGILSSVSEGRRLTQELLEQTPDLDCIYFSNDDVAFGGLCYCIEAGIAVPNSVALAGFNGLGLLEGFPGLIATSTTQRHDIGRASAGIITQSLQSPEQLKSRKLVMQPTINLGALQT
ncbi:LacI family DNA-binding transcriptional regulator [Octadecabacter antarcticus]|uniref:LacI family DNA-binding transcriptional regulator n=1 Tax=Octadecabacter antarcticus TaxID=1217908 RepID=UPI000180682C|nr:LacI family DNA-binding transcriptional regulator [Octadecabacter antarcticus]